MISYNKEILKEEAQKARQAQVMQAIQSRTTSTPKTKILFNEPVRISPNPKNHSFMHQTINKVLGNYDDVVEEMSKQPGHMIGIDKQTRSAKDTNHQAKTLKLRCNGYKMRPQASSKGMMGKDDTPRGQDTSSHGRCSGSNSGSSGCSGSNSSASYLGHGHGHQEGSRQGLLETPPEGAYSRNSQNSHSMSKDSGHGQNSIDNYRSRASQNSRLSTSSRMLTEKHGPDKDLHPKKHSYSSQNSFINPNNNVYSSSSSSSSSTQLGKHAPYPNVTTNSGNAHLKPNRPLSSLSDKSSSHGSNSEKYYRDKYHSGGEKSLQVDKFHSSADKAHADHKQYSDKTHNESKELSSNVGTSEKSLSNNSGREKSYSAEKAISHHLTKTKSRSPMPSLTPSVQSQQQGPPLLQSQQQQPHLQQPSKGPAAPAAIASTPPPPSLNMDGSRENHHTSLPSSLSPAYITNTVSSKPFMSTHLNKGLSNSLKVKIIGSDPAKVSGDLDDSESDNPPLQIEKIMKEMCQPEKITGIKTPSVKENLDEESNFLSSTGQQSQKHLLSELKLQKPSTPVHQTKLKAISPSLTHHRYQKQNLNTSPVLSDLKEEKNDLDKILAEMTCPESPVTAISTPEKMSENPFARSFKNSRSPSQTTLGLSESDSDSFDNEEDATQPPNDKPVHSCSSDENTNNQADASILKESKNMTLAAAEIKNHQNTDSVDEKQPLKTSPLKPTAAMPVFPLNAVKPSLQSRDLSQDLQISDSDSEAHESTKEFHPVFTPPKSSPSSPISRLHHSMDIGAVGTRKESVGFDIFGEHPTSESDSESDEVVAKTKSSTITVSSSAVTESNTVCNSTPLVYSTPARKGSGQFAKKNDNDADDEEEEDGDDDDDDDDDDDQSDVEESNELNRIGPAVKHQKPDVVSSSSSDSDSSDDESNVSEKASSPSDDDDDDNDEEEEDEDKDDHSKQLNSVEGVNDAEQCDSANVQITPRWCLSAFLQNSGNKANHVPKEAEEIVSVSSHTGSNVSASQRSRNNSSSSSSSSSSSGSSSSSSSSSGSSSCNENGSPVTKVNSYCESDDDSNSEKSSAEEKPLLIPSDNEEPPSSCHKQEVTNAPSITEDTASKGNSLQANTKSVTNLSTWPPGKDIQEFSSPVSSPMSVSPTLLVHRKLKRKISLPICIHTNLLSSIPNVKRRKLSNEPSQPAEHLDTIDSETVPKTWSTQMQSQESVEKQSENKQPWIKRDKSPRRTPNNSESNCCQKRFLTIKINTDLLHFIPAKCLKDKPSLQDVKTENNVEETAVKPEMQNGNSSPSVKVSEPNANTESFVMTQPTTTPVLTESTPCKAEKSDFKFRIPKRNLDSESYDISRPSPKMIKTEGQISKSEDNQLPNISKNESVKSLSSVNSDHNHSSSPSTESSIATSKTRTSDKEKQISSIDDTKQPCHDKEKDNAALPASPSECNSSGCSSSSNSNNNNSNNNGDDNIIDDNGDNSDSDSERDDSDHNGHIDSENTKKHGNSSGNNSSVNALTNSSSNKKLKTASQANLTSKSSSDNSKDTGKSVATPSPSKQSNSSTLLSPKGSTSSNTSDHHHHQPSTSAISTIPVTPSHSSNNLRNRPLYKGGSSNHHSSSDGGSSSHKGKDKVADHFFQEAKRMKHEGNKLTDIFEKSYLYMNAVVSYVQCGIALEKDQEQRCFRMFGEIFDFLNQIGHYHQYPHEQKISLLRLLLMSRVCKKLYDMKKKVADNLKLAIDEYNKQSSSTSLPSHTPSPHRPNWNTSTPSSRSTPSPSGSIDSIRSQGSNASDARLTPSASSSNAVSATSHSSSHISNSNSTSSSSSSNPNSSSLTSSSLPSSSQTVTIPKRIHSITQNYIEILDYIVKTHNYWEQAEIQKENCKDFIDLLHTRCKYISLQSSIFQYVEYVRVGLQILRES